METYRYYFTIIIQGTGVVTKFHTNNAPPRVGEYVDLEMLIPKPEGFPGDINQLKVVEVSHAYTKGQQDKEADTLDMVEIVLER